MKRLLKWLASAFHGLVMIEVVIMISPFAFYWYSLYARTLQGLHRSGGTAWTEAFFLPPWRLWNSGGLLNTVTPIRIRRTDRETWHLQEEILR
jgi:hypothetical protein